MAKILGLRKYSFNLFNRKERREKKPNDRKDIFKEITFVISVCYVFLPLKTLKAI